MGVSVSNGRFKKGSDHGKGEWKVKKAHDQVGGLSWPWPRNELTKKQVSRLLEELAALVAKNIGKKGPGVFVIPGLAKIKVIRKPATKARKGINPFTGKKRSSRPSRLATWSRFGRKSRSKIWCEAFGRRICSRNFGPSEGNLGVGNGPLSEERCLRDSPVAHLGIDFTVWARPSRKSLSGPCESTATALGRATPRPPVPRRRTTIRRTLDGVG